MTPKALRSARLSSRRDLRDFAGLLGIPETELQEMEAGTRPIERRVAERIELLQADGSGTSDH